ncbi:MAG: vWA domain-containing protein [Blastocatellia bacterium]
MPAEGASRSLLHSTGQGRQRVQRWWPLIPALCAAVLLLDAAAVRAQERIESTHSSHLTGPIRPLETPTAASILAVVVQTGLSTDQQMAELRRALRSFLESLPATIEVLFVPFDESVQGDLSTIRDRRQLLQLVDRLRPGQGADLYGAVTQTLDRLSNQPGPRTILLIADGVDWRTHSGVGEETLRRAERAGIPIHALQLTTRPDAEEMAHNQREMLGQADFGLIFGGPSSRKRRLPPPPPELEPVLDEEATASKPRSTPAPGTGASRPGEAKKDDPYKLPVPTIDLPPPGRQRIPGPEADRAPQPGRLPPQPRGRVPEERFPDATRPGRSQPEPPAGGGGFPGTARPRPDAIQETLDQLYQAADLYLTSLARLSGGSHRRVDPSGGLPTVMSTLARTLFPAP